MYIMCVCNIHAHLHILIYRFLIRSFPKRWAPTSAGIARCEVPGGTWRRVAIDTTLI